MERKGVEPSTSALRTHGSTVLSENLSEVVSTGKSRCTSGCTREPEKKRKARAIAEAQSTAAKGSDDFAAALAMIATLPLSDEEKAEAVRRLLRGR